MPYQPGHIPGNYGGYQPYGQPLPQQMYGGGGQQRGPTPYGNQQHMAITSAPPRNGVPPQYQTISPQPYHQQQQQQQQQRQQSPHGVWPPQQPAQLSPPYQAVSFGELSSQTLQQQNFYQTSSQQRFYSPQQNQSASPQGYQHVAPGRTQPAQAYVHAQQPPQPQWTQQSSPLQQGPTPTPPSLNTPLSRRPQQPAHPISQLPSTTPPVAKQSPQQTNQVSRPPTNPPAAVRQQQLGHQAGTPPVHVSSTQRTPQQHTNMPYQLQQTTVSLAEIEMPRSPKRRRSSDGSAIQVPRDMLVPQNQSASQPTKEMRSSSSLLTELPSSRHLPTPPPSVDYQAVLLSLADEYVAAAYSISPSIASQDASDKQIEGYHALMSTAMGCLESVLKNYRQPDPRREARIRLRLASLLYEETENTMEAEEVLSKGIALCERSRLPDLKYAMHHLLVRIMSTTNVRAAVRATEKLSAEVEALKLVSWFYLFRLLRISLGLQMGTHTEIPPMLKNLSAISHTAGNLRHVAVQIVAASLEAIIQLRTGTPEASELAQRALAAARTHQLGPEMKRLPQIRALLDCLDLACAIMQFKPQQVEAKMEQMHNNLDAASRERDRKKNDIFSVPLGVAAADDIELDTAGVLTKSEDGEICLSFKWLTRAQLYPLGYLLSGIATMHKSSGDTKAETFLNEGLKLSEATPEDFPQPLAVSTASTALQASTSKMARLQLIFAYCARNSWLQAERALDQLRAESTDVENKFMRAMLVFLDAVIKHAMGNLKAALSLYSARELGFSTEGRDANALKDVQALATLNSILILRKQGADDEADLLLMAVEPYCLTHSNKSLLSAYYVIKSSMQTTNAIIKTKQFLSSAIQAAQSTSNSQLLCVVMNFMTRSFFHNIVGDQAVKSVRASRTLAKKAQNQLWTAVADGMYAETLELCGEHREAEIARDEAKRLLVALPPALQQRLQKDMDAKA